MLPVQIRPAVAADLPTLMNIDHSCSTDYVWQMEIRAEEGQVSVIFREVRLPRTVAIPWPRPVEALSEDWSRRSGLLVAVNAAKEPVAYLRLTDKVLPQTAWITNLVVAPRYRRQGIATALVLASQSWSSERNNRYLIMEMSSKNVPAIRLAQKLGFEFCGYNDHYYENRDVALFFGRPL
ncbi:MAG: GNAT family N-acetyltransferase [Anaerolineales bacterium]